MSYSPIKFETRLKPIFWILSRMIHIECFFGEYQTGVVVNIFKLVK